MEKFNVPTRDEVNENNQGIFDTLKSSLTFVPNLYATMAHSDTALATYLTLQNSKTSFTNKEKEVINLAVSQVNECNYCLSAHTAISKMNGFSEEEIVEMRSGTAGFNDKFDALSKLAKEIASRKGRPDNGTLEAFYMVGYTKGSLVDLVIAVADKIVMNYLHNITQVPIDFPEAAPLELEQA